MTNIGGIVTARSVKLLDKLESMPEESDSRDKLWLELRKEIRSHMKTVGCTAVIGYRLGGSLDEFALFIKLEFQSFVNFTYFRYFRNVFYIQ